METTVNQRNGSKAPAEVTKSSPVITIKERNISVQRINNDELTIKMDNVQFYTLLDMMRELWDIGGARWNDHQYILNTALINEIKSNNSAGSDMASAALHPTNNAIRFIEKYHDFANDLEQLAKVDR